MELQEGLNNDEMQDVDVKELLQTLEKNGIHLKSIDEMEKMVDRVIAGETSFQDELNISDEALEALYFMGYTKYRNKRYKDSADIFAFIVAINPFHYNAIFGLASSRQMLKEYQPAIFFYYLAAPFSNGNPAPWFHVGECFLAIQEPELAKEAFSTLLDKTDMNGPYVAYAERAKAIIENLK